MPLKLAPQSLFGRLMMAVLVAVGLTLLVVVVLLVRDRRDLALLSTGAWSTAQIIADTSASLAQLQGEERDAAIARYLAESISTDDPPRPRRPPQRTDMTAVANAYASRIRRELGSGYVVEVTPSRLRAEDVIRVGIGGPGSRPDFPLPPPAPAPREGSPRPWGDARFGGFMNARFFDVNIALPDGKQLAFRTVAPQPGPPLPRQIFVELGVLTAILALVLYVMTRNITRPLSDLAQAAESVGRGARHAPLAERGAREVQDATRAFNTMQERLHRYLDSRTRVLAAMSHDLRTPLTRLRLRAESISDPDLKARFTSDLDEMNGMVQGALGLFRDLNDDEAMESVAVDELLRQLQMEFAEMGHEISIEGSAQHALLGRPRALKRCFANLLHNAVQYGTRARVFVTDGLEVKIRIQDDGPGIPEELIEQVFEPFFRVESSRNRDTGGTGLGLSIARDIVQAHGGTIRLNNLPDGGFEATVTLPRTMSKH